MADKLLKSIKFPTLPDRYVIGDSTLTEEGAAADAKAVGDEITNVKSALALYTKDVVTTALFNGLSSFCGFDQIVLSSNGDSIEFKVKTSVTRDSTTFYSFGTRGTNKNNVAIAIATNNISVRASDDTWLCQKNVTSDTDYRIIKIEYVNGNVVTSVNGNIINTYSGQKNLVIDWFGVNTSFGFWAGEIEYIKINDIAYSLSKMSGYVGTDIVYSLPNGLLTPEQANILNNISENLLTVIPSSNAINVYFHLKDNKYGNVLIKHTINHSDANYIDYWRVDDCYIAESNDGINFTNTSDLMLTGAENEMAILFRGFDDHVGGWHGDERIDLNSNCYVAFIINGFEYSISDLLQIGTIKCDSFSYREVSQLFAPYTYSTNHLLIANHTKITTLNKDGFTTTNFVEMDLSNFDQNTLKIASAYEGLFCIGTPFSNKLVSDIGTIYTAVHPTTTAVLVNNPNKYDNVIKTFNTNTKNSCIVNSKLINTNISGFINPPTHITLMDRADDNKYYSYLPTDINVVTDDYFATESSIKWKLI